MKKGFSILLLGLLMYHAIGFIIYFKIAVADWRQEVKSTITKGSREEEIVTFKFDKNTFDQNISEFIKDGRLYDVTHAAIDGDYLIVECLQDTHESKMIAEFNELFLERTDLNGDSHNSKPYSLIKLLKDYVFIHPGSIIALSNSSSDISLIITLSIVLHSTLFSKINTPPPQFID